MNSKEKILLATLELASEKGLGNISLSQIAKKVGVQKATLYSHFSSKGEIISCLYEYLRDNAKSSINSRVIDYGEIVNDRNALDVLIYVVESYKKMNTDENIKMFYKFVVSERAFNKEAAKIMVMETEKMILATKQLFYAMQIHKVMNFSDVDMAAISFSMAIHSLLDYQSDKGFAENVDVSKMINEYIENFYETYNEKEEI